MRMANRKPDARIENDKKKTWTAVLTWGNINYAYEKWCSLCKFVGLMVSMVFFSLAFRFSECSTDSRYKILILIYSSSKLVRRFAVLFYSRGIDFTFHTDWDANSRNWNRNWNQVEKPKSYCELLLHIYAMSTQGKWLGVMIPGEPQLKTKTGNEVSNFTIVVGKNRFQTIVETLFLAFACVLICYIGWS